MKLASQTLNPSMKYFSLSLKINDFRYCYLASFSATRLSMIKNKINLDLTKCQGTGEICSFVISVLRF